MRVGVVRRTCGACCTVDDMRAWLVGIIAATALSPACRDHGGDELQKAVDVACACKTKLDDLATKNELTALARVEAKACADDALRQVPKPTDGAKPSTHREQQLAREMMECVAKVYNYDTLNPTPPEGTEPAEPSAP